MDKILENTVQKLDLDKSKWKLVKFGDVAIQQKGTVDRENTELTKYIQGGHMNSEDLHIRNWGNLTDEYLGPAFIRKFEKGDILYGSRRTYLRKVAIADFDGITSNTTFVIKANENNIDKRLLPFIMMSEGFTENSIKNSKGSVNPYINWKDIAKYEFLLPPKEEQAKLAELLWAMDEVVEKEKRTLSSLLSYKSSLQKFLYLKDYPNRVRLSKYVNVIGGFAFSSTDFKNTGTPVVKIKNIVNGEIIIDSEENCIDEYNFKKIEKYKLSTNDILIAMTGATLGKIGIVQEEMNNCYLNQRVGKFELRAGISRECLYGIFDNNYFLLELKKYIGEGAQGNISSDDIAKCLVPKLSESKMIKYGNIFKSIYKSSRIIESKISSSKALQKSLINQVF